MCLAIPALVTALLPDQMARILLGGVGKTISVALLDDVAVEDYVIVHAGHALARIDAAQAARTMELLDEAVGKLAAMQAGG